MESLDLVDFLRDVIGKSEKELRVLEKDETNREIILPNVCFVDVEGIITNIIEFYRIAGYRQTHHGEFGMSFINDSSQKDVFYSYNENERELEIRIRSLYPKVR